MQKYEEQAVISALVALVKKGALALTEAAKQVHLSEEEFTAEMNRSK